MRIEFDWDPVKATSNLAKHQVSFEEAMSVFLDPLSLSRPDNYTEEERWLTIGLSNAARAVLVVHTFVALSDDVAAVRIISARRPTKAELRRYEDDPDV